MINIFPPASWVALKSSSTYWRRIGEKVTETRKTGGMCVCKEREADRWRVRKGERQTYRQIETETETGTNENYSKIYVT